MPLIKGPILSLTVRRPITVSLPTGGGGTSSGSGGTSSGGGSYWYENGAVWLMPSSGAAPQIVGFSSVTAMNQFCASNGGTLLTTANGPAGVYTAFSPQDFPVISENAGLWLFASQFATPFALSFLTNMFTAAQYPWTNQTASVGPLVPWSSNPLAVTGPGGPASVGLAYVVISASGDIASGIATQWI